MDGDGIFERWEIERCGVNCRSFAALRMTLCGRGSDGIGAAVDGCIACRLRCTERKDATVRAAVRVTGGLALALAMMHAGMETAPGAFRECTRITCAARSENMSTFRTQRSSLRNWARTAARS